MTDQPLAGISATVFKQFEIKLKEVGKAALLAGIAIPLSLVITALTAGHFPQWPDLKVSLLAGLGTALAVIGRDFFKPTITVIKGQVDPEVIVKPPATVITTDSK